MKQINLKTIGYLCLKTGTFFKTKAELLAFQSKKELLKFTYNLLRSVILSEKIEKAKALINTPFKKYCAKVSAYRAVKNWLVSLPKRERILFA